MKKNAMATHADISPRRVVAMVSAIIVNACLLLACLGPVARQPETSPDPWTNARSMELRFIAPERSMRAPESARHESRRRKPLLKPRQAAAAPLPALETKPRDAEPSASRDEPPIDAFERAASSPTDGGFAKRLGEAQRSVHGRPLPGSDTRVAPGINLVDPAQQGIGSMMRKAQRLFGVTSHHCTDVDAWRRLSPEQLAAMHMTERDVERVNEKYECNRPMGLAF